MRPGTTRHPQPGADAGDRTRSTSHKVAQRADESRGSSRATRPARKCKDVRAVNSGDPASCGVGPVRRDTNVHRVPAQTPEAAPRVGKTALGGVLAQCEERWIGPLKPPLRCRGASGRMTPGCCLSGSGRGAGQFSPAGCCIGRLHREPRPWTRCPGREPRRDAVSAA